jgi:Skp family chaperone for outer membrane proteins
LENEVKKVKENIQVALDKSSTDDQLIEALRAEITRLQQRLQRLQDDYQKKTASKSESAMKGMAAGDDHRQEEWNQKEQQYQSEVKQLKRLCNNQVKNNSFSILFSFQ